MLRGLPDQLADQVGRHLVAAGELVDEFPEQALAHALAARRAAPRLSPVREAVGLAAYHAGEWQTAIAELRTYHRMTGRQSHLAVLADCERALGRPERAIDLHREGQQAGLAPAEAIELLIVAAGARADLGQTEAAVEMLHVPELSGTEPAPWVARLRYAYAEALLATGREAEAREWLAQAAEVDETAETGAAARLLELDGVQLTERELDEDQELQPDEAVPGDALAAAAPAAGDQAPAEPAVAEPTASEVGAPEPSAAGRLVDPYDLVILDLDGVVVEGDQLIAGAAAAIAALRAEERPVVFATNNASRSAVDVAELLTGLGIPADPAQIVTSGMVAATALAARLPAGAAVLVLGAPALVDEVRQVGLEPVSDAVEKPAAVLQGYGPQVGWTMLAEATVAIRAGAQWVVTNTDATLPSPRGPLPGNGSLVAALQVALDREPDLVVGKPQPGLFTQAARSAQAGLPLVVGDRLDTDIEGAVAAQLDSLLVLTGVTDAASAAAAPASQRPTYLGADLSALFAPAQRRAG